MTYKQLVLSLALSDMYHFEVSHSYRHDDEQWEYNNEGKDLALSED